MSDPVTNVEIEDVLSSIRRLVSADARPDDTANEAGETNRRRTEPKLVLTPAQRVDDDDAAEEARQSDTQPEEDVLPEPEPELEAESHESSASDIPEDPQPEESQHEEMAAEYVEATPEVQEEAPAEHVEDHADEQIAEEQHQDDTSYADVEDAEIIDEVSEAEDNDTDKLPQDEEAMAATAQQNHEALLQGIPEFLIRPSEKASEEDVADDTSEAQTPDENDVHDRGDVVEASEEDALDDVPDAVEVADTDDVEEASANPDPEPLETAEDAEAAIADLVGAQLGDDDVSAEATAETEDDVTAAEEQVMVAEPVLDETDEGIEDAELVEQDLTARVETMEAAVAEQPDEWEPDGSIEETFSGETVEPLPWHDIETETRPVAEQEEKQLEHAARMDAAMSDSTMSDTAGGDDSEAWFGSDAVMDEEALRDMVGEIVRQELQGALGERITRNVRKLVRREIHRALMSKGIE